MNATLVTGFPRIGENRELKKALESYWAGKILQNELLLAAQNLRKKHWLLQKEKGIDLISCNDFSLYDNMLDTMVMLDAIPERFRKIDDPVDRYFAMARGTAEHEALEMTKWFNTNYHYLVPELKADIQFSLNSEKIISEFKETKSLGITPKINLIGPITFLSLSKTTDGSDPFQLLPLVSSIYKQLLAELSSLDQNIIIQIDEPVLVTDLSEKKLSLISSLYDDFAVACGNNKILLMTYFDQATEAVKELCNTKIWGIGLDFVYGKENLEVLDSLKDKILAAGIVNGRNIWVNDFDNSLAILNQISQIIPKKNIIISSSCSLLHLPFTTKNEPEGDVKDQLAFACEKLDEIVALSRLFHDSNSVPKDLLKKNRSLFAEKKKSNERERLLNFREREGCFDERIKQQKESLALPELPTTTIGSFPQTPEIRKIRREFKKGNITSANYDFEIKKYIDDCIAFQEKAGLDVLVHGEPERNDMVEYFGELLNGFHFTRNGWVQSYGSRCVKPPVIYSDVNRPEPMTVKWIGYAQSQTKKIMKGMLTGPVTILNWSFVREDIPRAETAYQIAEALSGEIDDLQKEGIKIIQVDEAAFKEGYPLRQDKISNYENWAVGCFKTAVSSAWPETQIHTHMCYSNFNDIMPTIARMDADVITIETARSGNKLLKVFSDSGYTNEIGPGIYDIHSPRIPSKEEIKKQIIDRLKVVNRSGMWVNPDCGLKTRKWKEVEPALCSMVKATEEIRNS